MVKIRDYEFKQIIVRDSYNRRALKYKNNIISYLKAFGITGDDIDVHMEAVSMRKAQARVRWYMWDKHLFFSYNNSSKFVENLGMIAQFINYSIYLLCEEEISQEEFLELFEEDKDVLKHRQESRKVLDVEEDSLDFQAIHQNYKDLSKKHHPDMPNGDVEKFKMINNAHKILKKELC